MQSSELKETFLNQELFAARFLKIEAIQKDGAGKLVPLVFNKAQKYYLANRTKRNIIVKPRQIGATTGILGLNFHELVVSPMLKRAVEIALVTHKEEISNYMLGIIARFRFNLPFDIETGIDSMDQLQVVCNFPDGKRYTSSMYVGTAGAKIFGRAQAFTRLHFTEIAHWSPERIQGILAGVLNALPAEGSVDIESTPNGRGGYFYDMYMAAKRNEVPYKPFFFPWWWGERYTMAADSGLCIPEDKRIVPSEEEQSLIDHHGLLLDQIRWRRWKFRELDRIQRDLFRQEFPENDMDCWLTASSVFDVQALQRMSNNILAPLETIDFCTVWKRKKWDRNYVIGVDVAEGLDSGAYTVAIVLDCLSGEIVAVLRARIPQEAFTELLLKLAHQYNTPLIAVERNMGQGILNDLMKQNYPNLYAYIDVDGSTGRLGFPTTSITRPMIIDEFRTAISEGSIIINDSVLIDECFNFQWIGGKKQAVPGTHDDTLFAAMIAWHVRESSPYLFVPAAPAEVVRYI